MDKFTSPEHHANEIFDDLRKQAIDKYLKGAREHGGNLWDVPLPQIVSYAKEEVLDQGSYLWTISEQLMALRLLCGELFEVLDAHEEPLDAESKKIIRQIKGLLGV